MSATLPADDCAVSSSIPTPAGETVRLLAVESGKYLGVDTGDEIPVEELRAQAKAQGYTDTEIDQLLDDAGVRGVDTVEVPPQADLLGELWRAGSSADDTGATAENWTDRPASSDGCSPEPLDDVVDDCYQLREPIADDPDLVDKDRYLDDDGDPMTHFDCVGSYIEQRHGESTTSERYGWEKGRQYHTKQQYKRGMAIDRQLLTNYDDPTTVLLSLRISPPDEGRLTMINAVSQAASDTTDQIRYRLQNCPDAPLTADDWEYIAVFAGTEKRATPHLHVYIWVDGDVSPDRFDPVVDKFVEECRFAPDDGRGNRPDEGAVEIRGNGDDNVPIADGIEESGATGDNSRGAVYVLSQLPHHKAVDEMARDELLHSSTMDAFGGRAYRSSMSEGEIEDEFLADGPM